MSRSLVAIAGISVTAAVFAQQQLRAEWWDRAGEAAVGDLRIKSDLPADQAQALTRHLILSHEQIQKTLGGLPPRGPAHLCAFLFAEDAEYRMTVRTRFGVDAAGRSAVSFSTTDINGLALSVESLNLRRIDCAIQHDALHQYARTRFGDDLPIWVEEGLAVMFGQASRVDSALAIAEINPRLLQDVAIAIEEQQYVPFERMFTMSREQWEEASGADRAALLSHQAWSMVHFLAFADVDRDGAADHAGTFQQYLSLLNRAFRRDDAYARSFGSIAPETLEQQWKAYMLSLSPSVFSAAMERVEFLAEGALALLDVGERPKSIDVLKAALRKINFTHEIQEHGFKTVLRASEDAMYSLPGGAEVEDSPAIVVSPVDPLKLEYRQRALEERLPSPPVIGTRGLPRNISVRWIRNAHGAVDRFEIVVSPR